jgi:hypothetical protein
MVRMRRSSGDGKNRTGTLPTGLRVEEPLDSATKYLLQQNMNSRRPH